MAYRRRQGLSRSSTFNEGILRQQDKDDVTPSSTTPSDRRLESFRSRGAFHLSFKNRSKSSGTFDNSFMKGANERGGFWGVLARKAKSILEDDAPKKSDDVITRGSKKPETIRFSTSSQFTGIQAHHQHEPVENSRKMDNPKLRMGLDRIMPSLNQIGDTLGNALEAENKTQSIIQEARNLQYRRRVFDNQAKNQDPRMQSAQPQKSQETQIQASRDVAKATAAKVKQLARMLKTVNAQLASAKDRCCQLEAENKLLQEAHDKGDHPADDDMIRVQLETLLEEKGRLAHENSVLARENRYLREIVEFHQLNMQDMVYLDEDIKETMQDMVYLDEGIIETMQHMLLLDEGIEGTLQDMVYLDEGFKETMQDMVHLDDGSKETMQDMVHLDNGSKETMQDMVHLNDGIKETKQDMVHLDKGIKETKQDMVHLNDGTKETKQDMVHLDKGNKETMQDMVHLDDGIKETKQDMVHIDKGIKEPS